MCGSPIWDVAAMGAAWAHLSCLSRHTATITNRFPRMAIRITAEMKVSSTIFSATPKPSLELLGGGGEGESGNKKRKDASEPGTAEQRAAGDHLQNKRQHGIFFLYLGTVPALGKRKHIY